MLVRLDLRSAWNYNLATNDEELRHISYTLLRVMIHVVWAGWIRLHKIKELC